MKKLMLLWSILILMFCSLDAYGWYAPGNHHDIADHAQVAPSMTPYLQRYAEYGLSVSSIDDIADTEPATPQPGWADISDSDLYDWSLNNNDLGLMMHAAGDSSVGVKHNPATWEHDAAHDLIELTAYLYYGVRTIDLSDFRMGSFSTKIDSIEAQILAQAADYHEWYDDQLIPIKSPEDMTRDSLENGVIVGEVVLKEFFDHEEVAAPSYAKGDWEFREGSGQITYSNKGSITTPLQLGSSTSSDSYEPTWEATSGWGATPCLRFKTYTANGNKANYIRQTSTWTTFEPGQLVPADHDYSIEAIVKSASMPNHTGSGNADSQLGILRLTGDYTAYRLKIYNKDIGGGVYHSVIHYEYRQADGTTKTYIYDTESDDAFKINPNSWYYIGVFYDYSESKLVMMVRDMWTLYTVSNTYTSAPALDPTPANVTFLIGSEYTSSSGHCFDGWINHVRITNRYLSTYQRIYNKVYDVSGGLAAWRMDFVTSSNKVIDYDRLNSGRNNDLTMSGNYVLKTGYGRKRILFGGTNGRGVAADTWPGGQSVAVELSICPNDVTVANGYIIGAKDIWYLETSTNNLVLRMYDVNGTLRSVTAPGLNQGSNYHIWACVYGDGYMELIVNDSYYSYTSPALMKNSSGKTIGVGARPLSSGADRYFNGYIDEVTLAQ